jgi:hypothetical protein
MSRTRPRNPENYKLTNAIKKAHEVSPNFVRQRFSKNRLLPPIPDRKVKVSLPKLRCLDDDP